MLGLLCSSVSWIVAGVFAFLSICLSTWQIVMHTRWNHHPTLKRYTVRIILMVPVYALESWLGLRFPAQAIYFDVLREVYEAFVIYSFYQFLVTYLGGGNKLNNAHMQEPFHFQSCTSSRKFCDHTA